MKKRLKNLVQRSDQNKGAAGLADAALQDEQSVLFQAIIEPAP